MSDYMSSVFERNFRPPVPNLPYNSDVGRVQLNNIVLARHYIGPIATGADSLKSGR